MAARATKWTVQLSAALLVALVAACGRQERADQPAATATRPPTSTLSPTPTETVTSPPSATTFAPTPEGLPSPSFETPNAPGRPDIAPPLALLESGAGSQEAGLGTYCWQAEEQGLCVDFAGIPIPETALAVQQGEQVVFTVPGVDGLVNVAVDVYDFARAQVVGGERQLLDPLPEVSSEGTRISYRNDGSAAVLTADLPPGQYAVAVFVGFVEATFQPVAPNPTATTVQGDAVYGFNIEVVAAVP
jgi:hypothetical protein